MSWRFLSTNASRPTNSSRYASSSFWIFSVIAESALPFSVPVERELWSASRRSIILKRSSITQKSFSQNPSRTDIHLQSHPSAITAFLFYTFSHQENQE